jgi:hypothetical protein
MKNFRDISCLSYMRSLRVCRFQWLDHPQNRGIQCAASVEGRQEKNSEHRFGAAASNALSIVVTSFRKNETLSQPHSFYLFKTKSITSLKC